METVGFSIGVVALASLFSTCVECWDYVEYARSHGRDYELLATQLEVEKTRFLIWGDVVGVLKPNGPGRDEVLNHPRVAPIVERILNHIISIFSDSEGLTSKYGLVQDKAAGDESNPVTLSTNQLSKYKASYKQFLAQVKAAQKRASLFTKTRWAIRDRSKFSALVDELRQLVDSLKDITESPTNRSQQQQHNAIVEEIGSLPDISALKLIRDATATVHQDWSDTVTELLETSALGSEDQEHIFKWINATDSTDLGYDRAQETLSEAGLDANARGFENLHWAAVNGHDHVVRFLLDHGVNVDARDPKLRTALLQAALTGKTYVIQLLIDRGANVEARALNMSTPLHVATSAGHSEAVIRLLRSSVIVDPLDEDRQTPLIRAVQLGDLVITKMLLTNGARIEARMSSGGRALHEAVRLNYPKVALLLLDWGADLEGTDARGETPLLEASRLGRIEIVGLLLERRANIEASCIEARTPLIWAVAGGHIEVAKALLAKGANLEARSSSKETPLLEAAWWPRADIVQLLIQHGSNLEARRIAGTRDTSLIRASYRGNVENVKALIEGGCQIDAVDLQYGMTPVMWAAECGHQPIMEYLISKGANLTRVNHKGRNILHLATASGHLEIVKHIVDRRRVPINSRANDGTTALLNAAEGGYHQIIELLLKNGASKNITNHLGEMPILLAIRSGHAEVTKLLIE